MKVIKKCVVVLMLMVIVMAGANEYMALASTDYSLYATVYTGDGGDIDTNTRKKETSSSAYIYNCYSDYGVNVRVWGKVKGVWKDCNVGLVVPCAKGEKKWLPNYVYEWNGYKSSYCYLRLSPISHVKGCIGGRWSPDSNQY